jgi:hypothetical protein
MSLPGKPTVEAWRVGDLVDGRHRAGPLGRGGKEALHRAGRLAWADEPGKSRADRVPDKAFERRTLELTGNGARFPEARPLVRVHLLDASEWWR